MTPDTPETMKAADAHRALGEHFLGKLALSTG